MIIGQKKEWFGTWFESPWYMRLYRHRTDSEAREAINLVKEVCKIPHNARILDVACGYGRHALALAEQGYVVTGLDYSRYLIDRARELYPHPHVTYMIGDMRSPYPGAPYDAIVNFFTSFGYFDTDEDNQSVLEAVRKALVPNGTFVLDFLNASVVRSTLVPESMHMFDGVTIIEEREIAEPFVKKTITINDPCTYEQVFEEKVWLYTQQQLTAMCERAGLYVQHTFGNYDGSAFNLESSKRCILVCKA